MSQRKTHKFTEIRIELDPTTNGKLTELAGLEGKSKRRMASVMLARIARMAMTQPDELRRMQLSKPEV